MEDGCDSPVVPSTPEFRLTAKQQEAEKLLLAQRHTLLVGGSRSGKTTLLVRAIAERARRAENSAPRHPAAACQRRARLDRARHAAESVPPVLSRRAA